MTDVRLAIRQLLKNPGFTVVSVVLTLALGIGVNTSMFSGLQALLRPELPYPEPGRLVRVFRTSSHSQRWLIRRPTSWINRQEFGLRADGSSPFAFNLAQPGEQAERLRGLEVTADLIPLLGVKPLLGRASLRMRTSPDRTA